jgi:hypothetical protein
MGRAPATPAEEAGARLAVALTEADMLERRQAPLVV